MTPMYLHPDNPHHILLQIIILKNTTNNITYNKTCEDSQITSEKNYFLSRVYHLKLNAWAPLNPGG